MSCSSLTPGVPSPLDFHTFIPWACKQFKVTVNVAVTPTVMGDNQVTSARSRIRPNVSKMIENKSNKNNNLMLLDIITPNSVDNVVRLISVYDTQSNLVEIKFVKNMSLITRKIFKVIGMVIQFYTQLQTITVREANNDIIYEINNLVKLSNVTDINIEDSPLVDGNYHIFIENTNCLKHLALTRCELNDDDVLKLTSLLHYPRPSSKTLHILNLAHNHITDIGAKYISEVLRNNRELRYLNLTNNWISDDGALAILGSLQEFALTLEEVMASRRRYVTYLKEQNELVARYLIDLKTYQGDGSSASDKKKSPKSRGKNFVAPTELSTRDATLKAEMMAKNLMGPFEDPFSFNNIVTRNGTSYCRGNTALAYINISYNHIGYLTVKKVLKVLKYQQYYLKCCPVGLINVCVEGNNLPKTCQELREIDSLIETVVANTIRISNPKNRRMTITKSRLY